MKITILSITALLFTSYTNIPLAPQKFLKSQINVLKIDSVQELKAVNLNSEENIATRCNNPGCIRNGNSKLDALAIGYINTINGKFLVFDTPQVGFYALQLWIRDRGHWSLKKAISKFAPSIENNTSKYISDLCRSLGCHSNTKLSAINEIQLIVGIAKIEGYRI